MLDRKFCLHAKTTATKKKKKERKTPMKLPLGLEVLLIHPAYWY